MRLSLSLYFCFSPARKIPDVAPSKFFLPSDISFRDKETLEKRGRRTANRARGIPLQVIVSLFFDAANVRGRFYTIERLPWRWVDSPGTAAVARKWWKHVELSRDLRGTLLITRATGSEGDSAFIKQKACVDLMGEPFFVSISLLPGLHIFIT